LAPLIWLLVAVMVLHGLIHLIGGLNGTGLASTPGLSGHTLIALSGFWRTLLGVLWFVAVALFLASSASLAMRQAWWKSVAIAAVLVSQALIVLWWPDAKWGTVANLVVVIGCLAL